MTALTLTSLDARLSAVEAKIDPDAALMAQAEDILHRYAVGNGVWIAEMRSKLRGNFVAHKRGNLAHKCIAAGIPVRVIARVLNKTERGVRVMLGRA